MQDVMTLVELIAERDKIYDVFIRELLATILADAEAGIDVKAPDYKPNMVNRWRRGRA